MFSSSLMAIWAFVQMSAMRLRALEGTAKTAEYRAHAVERSHVSPLPTMVPPSCVLGSGLMYDKLAPSVGSTPELPNELMNVAGIVSAVPALVSCASPSRTAIAPATVYFSLH